MSSYLRIALSRWLSSVALASMLAVSMFSLTSSPLFAAACDPATPLDASTTAASCDMSVTARVNPGVLTLANDAAVTVPGSPFTLSGADISATISFTSIVKDHRGSTSGWALSASSAGLVNGSLTIPINLTSEADTSSCTNGTCPSTTFIALSPIPTTPATFLHAGNTGHTVVVDGDYTNHTNGTFSIPAGSPSGSYTGTVTITLSNAF